MKWIRIEWNTIDWSGVEWRVEKDKTNAHTRSRPWTIAVKYKAPGALHPKAHTKTTSTKRPELCPQKQTLKKIKVTL